jgi:mannose/fructose/N-acetylgalactosamine-specific phosphotransferase system component IIB
VITSALYAEYLKTIKRNVFIIVKDAIYADLVLRKTFSIAMPVKHAWQYL